MKTRWILAALAACALALLAAGCNNAEQENGAKKPTMEGGTIDDNGVLTNYKGFAAAVVIPNGVTGIGSYAFRWRTSLESVEIPDSVTSIGEFAFYECTSLAEVNYTGTLAQWCALDGNGYLMYYAKSVTMNDGTDLKTMSTLEIPGGVTSIGDDAFYECTSLESVEIPDGVTSIGHDAFWGCTSLAEVNYTGTLAQWCALDDNGFLMYFAESVTMNDGTDLKTMSMLEIPYGVTEIGGSAFKRCTSLESVKIPEGVTGIGSGAFYECKSLKSVEIPDGVTGIGSGAFGECKSLTDVTIGNGVTSIGGDAFRECTSLKSVKIPGSVTSIGSGAFFFCTSLAEVNYTGTLAQWCALDDNGFLMYYAKSVTMNDGTDLRTMSTLEIPGGVTSIGGDAFRECTSLTDVTIGNGVTSIGGNAFRECKSLTDVTIGNGVTSIENYAFEGCNKLKNVRYNGTEEEWRNNITIASDSGLSGKTITGKDADGNEVQWTAQ